MLTQKSDAHGEKEIHTKCLKEKLMQIGHMCLPDIDERITLN
jgi:hypothetical protein